MDYSEFGQKFSSKSGIVELMEDLGNALNENPEMLFMGGGNPGRVPEVEFYFKEQFSTMVEDPKALHSLLGIYQSPQGEKGFRDELAEYLARTFKWPVTAKNIAVSNGSQSAFFIIYNLLAGKMPSGDKKTIHFPLAPEYIGYADSGLTNDFFTSTKPRIEILDSFTFKYLIDFSALDKNITKNVAALSVSRPTNPTGNVITDKELNQLDSIAKQANIPLIIDGAYGLPFPAILFTDAKAHWNQNTIVVLSLSKLGLPGIRTGIVVANEQFIQDFTNTNIITNLACGTLGPALCKNLFSKNEINNLTDKVTPFYQVKADKTVKLLKQQLGDIPFKIHTPEGAIFLWLWFEGLPIRSKALYKRLKAKGVLVIPGEDFFIGIDDNWQHKYECIRLSYAQDESVVKKAIHIIAQEVKSV